MRTLTRLSVIAAVAAPLLGACTGPPPMPEPRSVIVFTGARVQADVEEMREVDRWLRAQDEHIQQSRDFVIHALRHDSAEYPWDTLEITGDTARIFVQHLAPDTETPYVLYAHFHLMAQRGELEEWLPEAPEAEGFELERAILSRIAAVWLYGRAVFDTQAHGPLDELLYAREYGFLDEFILATQGSRFSEEKASYYEEHPERREEFHRWLMETFEREEPGYMRAEEEEGR